MIKHRRFLSGTALAVAGCASLAQVLGLIAAALVPYDSQGAVGKAFVAIFTQFGATPLALLGIGLAVAARIASGRFDGNTRFALVLAVVGLLPLALFYVSLVS
ncbi:MAG: hypothetical protein WD069_16790 [Planctomycetales bacterium]